MFDLDYLTDSMNYQPVRSENQANKHAGPKEANHSAGTQDNIDTGNSEMEAESAQDYFVLPIWSSYTSTVKNSEAKNEGENSTKNTDLKTNEKPVDQEDQAFLNELERLKRQEKEANDASEALRKEFAQDTEDLLLRRAKERAPARATSTNTVNTASTPVSTAPSGGLSYPDLNITDQDDSQNLLLRIFMTIQMKHVLFACFCLKLNQEISEALEDKLDECYAGRTAAIQYSESMDSCRFALWEEGNWTHKMVTKITRMKEVLWLEIRQGGCPGDIGKEVTPKTSHLNVVKRIFSILKKVPQQEVVNSAGTYFMAIAREQKLVLPLLQRAESVAARQLLWAKVLWIYKIKMYFNSKTKHIEIRHHFIRDAYEKKLIQVLKIHTDDNVADLLTKLLGC
ncbi:hypothetical protein Tco_1438482 [Tanacetum coccineum]